MVNFRAIEKKWQKKWEKAKIFEADIDKKREKLFMAIPYPYTSGPLHIGHGRTYTVADVWVRFRRMQGLNALWPMAFHITGTPILAVSKKIKAKDKETIKLYKEYVGLYIKDKKKIDKIINSFEEPQNVADFFANVINKDFKSLGFSIDWRRSFTTGDKDYNKFIEWQFTRLRDKNLIKKGQHPVQYCLNCKNAVGEDDIKDGDILSTGIQTFTAIKFPFEDGFLVAATLRPETIFGLTNLWVNPEKDYVKAKVNNEIWYVSKEASRKLSYQNHKIEVIEEFKGKNLIGKHCSSTIENKKVLVLPATFVDTKATLGIVYSVPAHAPDDYMGLYDLQNNLKECKKYGLNFKEIKNIKSISIIRVKNFGEFPAKEICEQLKIKSQEEREKLEEATKKIYKGEFYHGVLKENCKQFAGIAIKNMKEEVKDWLKEQGKSIDFYESETSNLRCRDGGEVVVKVISDQWFIDYGNEEWKEKAKKCLSRMIIIPETYRKMFEQTIDWLHERACARERGLGTRLPWDKKWIIESLSDSTIYPAFYTLIYKLRKNKIKSEQLKLSFFDYIYLNKGNVLKISKETKINTKFLKELKEEFDYWYPVDERHTATPHITNHLTFYIFNHAILFPEKYWPKAITLNELLIAEGAKMSKSKGNVVPLVDISKKYTADLYRLYMIYGADLDTVIDWKEKNIEMLRRKLNYFYELANEIIKNKKRKTKLENIDKWLLSKFNKTLFNIDKEAINFKLREYTQKVFFEIMGDFSYYFRRTNQKNYFLLNKILIDWLKYLTPTIPHLCEELWNKEGNKGFISIEKLPKINRKLINEKIEKLEEVIKETLDDIRAILRLIEIKAKIIHLYILPNEFNLFNEAKFFFEKELKLKIKIWKTNDPKKIDPMNKSKKAKLGKPAIFVE